MNVTFLDSYHAVYSLIAFLITFYPITIIGWLFSWKIIIRNISKSRCAAKDPKTEDKDHLGERRRAQAVGLAIIYLAITTLGLGTRAVIWQGSSDEATVYRSYVLETYMNQTLIRQKNYHLAENYTVQDLHQTDDTHRHPKDVAQGAVTSLKHGPVDTDLVQLTYTMNDATHQAVVKVPRNQYYALFTSVRNAPLPMSLVDNQLVVDTYYQPAPDLTINYQIGGEKSFWLDLAKVISILGVFVWYFICGGVIVVFLISVVIMPEDLTVKACLLACAFVISTFVVMPHVPSLSGPWTKDNQQASLLVTQNGQATYYQPDYDIGEVTLPGKLYMGKDAPGIMWGSKVTIVDIKHGEPGSNMVRLTYQTSTERNHVYVEMTDDQFYYLYRHLGLRITAVISNGDVIIRQRYR